MCKACYNPLTGFEYLFETDAFIRHSNNRTAKRIRAQRRKWGQVSK